MKFIEALINVVNLNGVEILNQKRIVNILGELNAFVGIPAFRGIMTIAINEGFMKELTDDWAANSSKVNQELVEGWGIDTTRAVTFINCVGMTIDESLIVGKPDNSLQAPLNEKSPTTEYLMSASKEAVQDYFTERLIITDETVKELVPLGITVKNPYITEDSDGNARISFELIGIFDPEDDSYIDIDCDVMFYDAKDRLRIKGRIQDELDYFSGHGLVSSPVYYWGDEDNPIKFRDIIAAGIDRILLDDSGPGIRLLHSDEDDQPADDQP